MRHGGRDGGLLGRACSSVLSTTVCACILTGTLLWIDTPLAVASINPNLCETAAREVLLEVAVQRATDIVVVELPPDHPPGTRVVVDDVLKGTLRRGDPFVFRWYEPPRPGLRYLLLLEPDAHGELRLVVEDLRPELFVDTLLFCWRTRGERWPEYRERLRSAVLHERPEVLRASSDLVVEAIVESTGSGLISLLRILAADGRAELPNRGELREVTAYDLEHPRQGPIRALVPPMKTGDHAIFFLEAGPDGRLRLHGGLYSKWRLDGGEFRVEGPYARDRILARVDADTLRTLLGLPARD